MPLAHPYWPALPHLEENALEHFDPDNEAQILQFAERLCGQPVPEGETLGERLGKLLEENVLLRLLEGHPGVPREMDELVAYLQQQPERRGITDQALAQEITAYLLIGSQAHRGQEPRLRPKVHMFFRGLGCSACKHVYTCNVHGVCPATCCTGTLQPLKVDHENYYVHTYLERQLVSLSPHEHSGQLDGRTREEYEEAFRKGTVNVLVCTPTLELGVDIGDLLVVMMRNIPPGPANYAQRSGRAGRAERIAFIVAFARNRGHDTYYYDKPAEMIRGLVRAPIFGFDNQRIIRRHIHALILEKLQEQFPAVMAEIVNEYDDVAGGAGYVERLSTLLPEAAAAVLERLVNCACVDSCYRCLRSYRNQSEHTLLDKRQIIETLQRITETAAIPSMTHNKTGD